MELRFSDFESKKEISAVKLSFENEPAFEVARSYKIAIPASSIAAPYITYGNKSDLRANTFMQHIGTINVRGCTTDIFEQDMLDFKYEELRSVGAVVFNQEKFGWKLKDLNTGEEYNLDEITAIKHLGSLYDHKSFAGCSIEIIYKLLGKEMPKEIQYSALDEEIPFHKPRKTEPKKEEKEDEVRVYVDVARHNDGSVGWGYKLEYKEDTKTDARIFTKAINRREYYIVAGTIIALSKLKKQAPIKLYTTMPDFADAINNKHLKAFGQNEWIEKTSGEKIDNLMILKELKGHMDRLGGNITAVVVEKIGIAS